MSFSTKPVAAIAAAVCVVCFADFGNAATTNVAYGGTLTFRPSNLTINAGDTVIWTNAGGSHNVVGDTAGTPLCGCTTSIPGFTNTFTVPGDYLYHCFFHQSFNM